MQNSNKPRRRKDLRPQEIVSAALEVFAEEGFAGSTVEGIAARAGAAKGTVYRYFASKDELFEAAIKQNISPFFDKVRDFSSHRDMPVAELLSTIVRAIYLELVEHPERRTIMKVLIAEGHRFPQLTKFYYDEILAGAQAMLREILQRGIDSGEFHATKAIRTPQVIVAPAMMAMIWKMSFDEVSPIDLGDYVDAHLDLMLHGLCVKVRSPSD